MSDDPNLALARSFAPDPEHPKRLWCDCLHYCIGRNVDRGGIVRLECQGLPGAPETHSELHGEKT